MFIYLFTNKFTDNYDQVEKAVVIAESSLAARYLMLKKGLTGSDNRALWEDPQKVTCDYLGRAYTGAEAAIVCRDIHEG